MISQEMMDKHLSFYPQIDGAFSRVASRYSDELVDPDYYYSLPQDRKSEVLVDFWTAGVVFLASDYVPDDRVHVVAQTSELAVDHKKPPLAYAHSIPIELIALGRTLDEIRSTVYRGMPEVMFARKDATGCVLLGQEFVYNAMREPVPTLAQVVLTLSQSRDYFAGRMEVDSRGMRVIRAQALQAEILRLGRLQNPDVPLPAYQQQILETYQHGVGDMPATFWYSTPGEFPYVDTANN